MAHSREHTLQSFTRLPALPKILSVASIALLGLATTSVAQVRLVPPMPDLTGVISDEITDGKTGEEWAMVLGKALFWDQQLGSDGVACASCHFAAGADTRIINQISPGANDVTSGQIGDSFFGATRSDIGRPMGTMASGNLADVNYTLTEADFPLHQIEDDQDRDATVEITTNDIISSQGAYQADFVRVGTVTGKETCNLVESAHFQVNGFSARQVALRNSSTTINAIFNRRSLWDGSANNLFNGVGSFGMRDIVGDPNKRLVVLNDLGEPELGYVELTNASLASQAVGPPANSIEMSCRGRTLADVGRKLMAPAVRPLDKQAIAASDSLFEGLIDVSGKGLANGLTYKELVQRAFNSSYWAADGMFSVADGELITGASNTSYTQIEHNWSLFLGVSILLYESTLISNVSEFDALLNSRAITVRDIRSGPPFGCFGDETVDPLLLRGCQIFFQARDDSTTPIGAGCNSCHGGKDIFTNAGSQRNQTTAPMARVSSVLTHASEPPGMVDLGFPNTGVRPLFTDLRLGGLDPYGNPLSYAKQYKGYLVALAEGQTQEEALADIHDPDLVTAILTDTVIVTGNTLTAESKVNVEGAGKTPTLRNVALTPPYTASGTYATLRDMMKFYNRGGNRRTIDGAGDIDAGVTACTKGDDSGNGVDGLSSLDDLQNGSETDCHSNVSLGIGPLNMIDCDLEENDCDPATDDLAALERFLLSLTDPRVQCDAAPFDHPSLVITNGHRVIDGNKDGRADDRIFVLPEVGEAGYSTTSGFCLPNSGNLFAPGMQARAGGARVPL